MARKILILGANGMLGHMLGRKLAENFTVIGTARSITPELTTILPKVELHQVADICDLDTITKLLSRTKPDVIINCIGVIKQSSAVKEVAQMYHINGFFPQQLAVLAKNAGAKVIHFSTDCVFNGKKGQPYTINDVPTAEDDYGKSKLLGELHGEHTLTLRTSIIGRELSRHGSLIDWFIGQRGNAIKGYKHALYSGVTTLEMAAIITHILENKPNLHGVYQLAGAEISKFELLQRLNELLNHGTKITPDEEFFCDRRLDGSAFEKASNYKVNSWEIMLQNFAADNNFYNK